MARLCHREPDRWCGITANWRDAWLRKPVHAVLHVDADAGRQRLNRGHRFLGHRRWDEVVQKHVDTEAPTEVPWQHAALDREFWSSLEEGLVARVLRRAAVPPIHGDLRRN